MERHSGRACRTYSSHRGASVSPPGRSWHLGWPAGNRALEVCAGARRSLPAGRRRSTTDLGAGQEHLHLRRYLRRDRSRPRLGRRGLRHRRGLEGGARVGVVPSSPRRPGPGQRITRNAGVAHEVDARAPGVDDGTPRSATVGRCARRSRDDERAKLRAGVRAGARHHARPLSPSIARGGRPAAPRADRQESRASGDRMRLPERRRHAAGFA